MVQQTVFASHNVAGIYWDFTCFSKSHSYGLRNMKLTFPKLLLFCRYRVFNCLLHGKYEDENIRLSCNSSIFYVVVTSRSNCSLPSSNKVVIRLALAHPNTLETEKLS